MTMGNYFEVLEMSQSIREIHDASSQSCSSLLVKNQMPWYNTSEVSRFNYFDNATAI